MEPGASIAQPIDSVNREPGFVAGAPGILCFSARALAASGARLRVAGLAPLPTELPLTPAGDAAKRCVDVVLAPRFRLEFRRCRAQWRSRPSALHASATIAHVPRERQRGSAARGDSCAQREPHGAAALS